MKRSFISFPSKHAPKIVSKRMGLKNFASAAYKSDADLTAEQQKEALLTKIKADQKEVIAQEFETRGYQSKSEVDKAISDKLADKMKDFEGLDLQGLRDANLTQLREDLRTTAAKLQKLETEGIGRTEQRQTIAGQIRSYIEKNKDAFAEFKSGSRRAFGTDKNGDASIELRAAATMTLTGQTTPSVFVPNVEIIPGVIGLSRNRPFIEQYANTAPTTSPRIIWTEKWNPQGNAAFIAEGALKPLISFEFRTNESFAKKVADKIKVSTEMLDDVDFIAAEIENELKYQVDIVVDAALLTGAGNGTVSATALKGLTTSVGGYVLTTITTTTPNNFDAVRAAIAQIVSLNFNPDSLFINPIDGANMDIVKDSQGRPLAMEYKDLNGRIYRLQPVETNQIPVGSVLVADMSRFKVRNYKPFSIYYGWVNDDFELNLVTIIGERRVHAFVSANEVGAFVYDTFANIKTAIT